MVKSKKIFSTLIILMFIFIITMLVPRRANAVCPYVIYICYILSAINIQYARCNINHYDHYSSRTDNSHKCSGFHSFSEFQFLSYEEISCCQRNACDSQCKTCIKALWHACYSYCVLALLQVKAYKVTENLVI